MKKRIGVFLGILVLFGCSCAPSGSTSVAPGSSAPSSQTELAESTSNLPEKTGMTMVRPNSPPVCKMTEDPFVIQAVKERIDAADKKEEYVGTVGGGWVLKIDFPNGSWCSLSGDLLCTDQKNYWLETAVSEKLYEELMAIYQAIVGEETPYTGNA